jgi:hypothetical protein
VAVAPTTQQSTSRGYSDPYFSTHDDTPAVLASPRRAIASAQVTRLVDPQSAITAQTDTPDPVYARRDSSTDHVRSRRLQSADAPPLRICSPVFTSRLDYPTAAKLRLLDRRSLDRSAPIDDPLLCASRPLDTHPGLTSRRLSSPQRLSARFLLTALIASRWAVPTRQDARTPPETNQRSLTRQILPDAVITGQLDRPLLLGSALSDCTSVVRPYLTTAPLDSLTCLDSTGGTPPPRPVSPTRIGRLPPHPARPVISAPFSPVLCDPPERVGSSPTDVPAHIGSHPLDIRCRAYSTGPFPTGHPTRSHGFTDIPSARIRRLPEPTLQLMPALAQAHRQAHPSPPRPPA